MQAEWEPVSTINSSFISLRRHCEEYWCHRAPIMNTELPWPPHSPGWQCATGIYGIYGIYTMSLTIPLGLRGRSNT